MKLSDFKNPEFKHMSDMTLTEWVINGDHCPQVKIYLNEKILKCFSYQKNI